MAGSEKNQCQNFSIYIFLLQEQRWKKIVYQKFSVGQIFGSPPIWTQGAPPTPRGFREKFCCHLSSFYTISMHLSQKNLKKKIFFVELTPVYMCQQVLIRRKSGKKEFLKSYIVLLRAELNCTIYASRMGQSAGASQVAT